MLSRRQEGWLAPAKASLAFKQRQQAALPDCDIAKQWQSQNEKPFSPKGRNGHQVAVSPFDGANRIRFKGSPRLAIANCGLRIRPHLSANLQSEDSQPLYGSPENFVAAVYYNSPSEFRGCSTRSVAMTLAWLFKAG